MAKKGHDISIYTSDCDPVYEDASSLAGVRICVFKTIYNLGNFPITPGIIQRAKTEISSFDLIHMHNFRTFQNIVIHYYAKKNNIPYILQPHGSIETFFQKGLLKKFFDDVLGNNILNEACRLIAVSPREANNFKQVGIKDERINIVPNGIDLSEFDNLPPRGNFRKKAGIDDRQKIVLYLGKIDKIKGLDLLLSAFAGLFANNKSIRLVMAGPDYGYLSYLKKMVRAFGLDREVLFTGPLYARDKLEAYVDADVFVLPSFYEVFGIVALEAHACGTPVIVTDRCGIASYNKNIGTTVIPYDKGELTKALYDVLARGIPLDKLGKKYIEENLGWHRIAEQMEKVYQEVLGEKSMRFNK